MTKTSPAQVTKTNFITGDVTLGLTETLYELARRTNVTLRITAHTKEKKSGLASFFFGQSETIHFSCTGSQSNVSLFFRSLGKYVQHIQYLQQESTYTKELTAPKKANLPKHIKAQALDLGLTVTIQVKHKPTSHFFSPRTSHITVLATGRNINLDKFKNYLATL